MIESTLRFSGLYGNWVGPVCEGQVSRNKNVPISTLIQLGNVTVTNIIYKGTNIYKGIFILI